jgi:hypothetical protein
MPSKPILDSSSAEKTPAAPEGQTPGEPASGEASDLTGKLTEFTQRLAKFTQRLASFGLGEAPDPLLTDARPPAKQRAKS